MKFDMRNDKLRKFYCSTTEGIYMTAFKKLKKRFKGLGFMDYQNTLMLHVSKGIKEGRYENVEKVELTAYEIIKVIFDAVNPPDLPKHLHV